tara:strand:- start:367 stop:1380 length:1014 start_codon:yes stop_codon:yes gene_type:complete
MKRTKTLHDQINWFAKKLIAEKNKDSNLFHYDDETAVEDGGDYNNKTQDAVTSILLSMPKSKLKKLVSSSSLCNMPTYSYWRGNNFVTSSYSGTSRRYSVKRNYLKSIPNLNSIKAKQNFIQFIASSFGNACARKPKLFKWSMKNSNGLFLYYTLNTRYRYKNMDNDLVKILLRTKDERVQKIAIDKMEATKLKRFNEKYIDTELVTLKPSAIYKISSRLKNQAHPDTFSSFIENYKENPEGSIPWTYQAKVRNNLSYIVEDFTQKQIIGYSQTLIQMVNKELNYGSYYYLGNNCLHTLISYITKEKALFLLNGIENESLRKQLSNIISSEETQWDN